MKETVLYVLKTVGGYVAEYSIRIVIAGFILFLGFKLSAYLINKYPKANGKNKLSPEATSFIKSGVSIVAKALIIITSIAIVGIPIASVITVLASAGVAIGLAIQGSLSNVAGGVIIVLIKPFRVGDVITVGGSTGTVSAIDIFYTRLITPDNKAILIPNGQLMNAQIENITAFNYRRVDLNFSADYTCDMEKVKAVMLETANKTSNVILQPVDEAVSPFVAVSQQADSAVIYTLRVWCKKENYADVMFELTESMKKAFDDNNISIPYPQLDLHMVKD